MAISDGVFIPPVYRLFLDASALPDLCLRIDGHTDSTGDKDYNHGLSQRRAEAIKAALSKLGPMEARLQAKGHGADSPVADNSTVEGRAQNRRVELHKVQCE